MAFVTLIVTLVFGKRYRNSADRSDDEKPEGLDIAIAIIVGCICGLLYLPFSACCTKCCKTRFISESTANKSQSSKKAMDSFKMPDSDESRMRRDMEHPPHTQDFLRTEKQDPDPITLTKVNDEVRTMDSCIAGKCFLIAFAYAFSIASIIFLAIQSGRVIRAQSVCMVIAWVVALVSGTLLWNMLRIVFISCCTKEENSDCAMIVPKEAEEMLKDMKLILQIMSGERAKPQGAKGGRQKAYLEKG